MKTSMFAKTFVTTTAMLLGIILMAYLLAYLLLPQFYESRLTRLTHSKFQANLTALEESGDTQDEIQILLNAFSNADIRLMGEQGLLFQRTSLGISIMGDVGDFRQEVSANHLEFTFEYSAQNERRILTLSLPLDAIDDARQVMRDMYPLAILLSAGFGTALSYLFSRWVIVPIKTLKAATLSMGKFEQNHPLTLNRHDELGQLGTSINELYGTLRQTIESLESEIKKQVTAENKKLEFLQTVSHEMKAPLVSASALVAGMVHDIPPFDMDKDQHLLTLKRLLDQSIQLTKESLKLSESHKAPPETIRLSELIQDMSHLYGIIFTSKQLAYEENIPDDVVLTLKADLLRKVLSNLYANAAAYTSRGGTIRVSYDSGTLSIANTCEPLPKEQRDKIFAPLMSYQSDVHSTGLGLFIVKQFLLQLQMDYQFEPLDDGSGMVFRIFLEEK